VPSFVTDLYVVFWITEDSPVWGMVKQVHLDPIAWRAGVFLLWRGVAVLLLHHVATCDVYTATIAISLPPFPFLINKHHHQQQQLVHTTPYDRPVHKVALFVA
jgi:hypothetical protein